MTLGQRLPQAGYSTMAPCQSKYLAHPFWTPTCFFRKPATTPREPFTSMPDLLSMSKFLSSIT